MRHQVGVVISGDGLQRGLQLLLFEHLAGSHRDLCRLDELIEIVVQLFGADQVNLVADEVELFGPVLDLLQ